MTDIYDIKTFLFWFIYSFDYFFIIWAIIFFIFFYLLLSFVFKSEKIKIDTKKIEDDFIRERLEYLIKNIENLSREIFYREVWIFLRNLIFRKFQDKSVFFMTLEEIQKDFKNEYNEILKEVYYLEFNKNLEDNFKIRKNILEKIKL